MNKTDSCFLAIDKPQGISSFEVIRRLRKITGIRKIGHTGTLDPFATGLLICCIGSYTRLASLVEAQDKVYQARVQLGIKTSTGDPEGEVVETAPVNLDGIDWSDLEQQALQLKELPIPAYSAVKVNGKRAYSLARQGEIPALPPRAVQISQFEFIHGENGEILDQDMRISYLCRVSKGTYIRSLSEWIAARLGTIGSSIELRRVSVGNITISSGENLERFTGDTWRSYQLDPCKVLGQLPVLEVDELQLTAIEHGIDLPWPEEMPEGKVAVYHQARLLAIGEKNLDKLHPHIVLI